MYLLVLESLSLLHNFSDASTCGYGQCSYMRLVNKDGEFSCSLVVAKSRVNHIKSVTIPRLELTVVLVSVKVASIISKELTLSNFTGLIVQLC